MCPFLMPTSEALQGKGIPGPLELTLVLLAISMFINYVDRGNLSIAGPLLKDELGISASQLGILFSAFFFTYGLFQLVSGWLVDRYNVNWILAGGFFLWSVATAATGLAHVFASILVFRLLVGIGESVAYPPTQKSSPAISRKRSAALPTACSPPGSSWDPDLACSSAAC